MTSNEHIPFVKPSCYNELKSGRTGAYRVRKGWFGKSILQYQWLVKRSDSEGGGWKLGWSDENYTDAPYVLVFDTPYFAREKADA